MSKTITLRISEDHYEAFKQYAKTENRKISNAIETLAMKELENTLTKLVEGIRQIAFDLRPFLPQTAEQYLFLND